MKKIFTLLLFVLFLFAKGNAQHIEGLAGFLKGGYMRASLSATTFNQVAPAGITGFTDNYFLFGAEAYYRKCKNIYVVEGQMGAQKAYVYAHEYAEPYCGAAHGKWGKVIAENEYYWLYPTIGAGASVLQLTTYDKVGKKIDNIREKTLVSPSFDAGINADFLISKPKWDKGYYLGWMMGVRAGYRASINSNKWKDENALKPYYMPAYANNAFYVTVTIGAGSFDKK